MHFHTQKQHKYGWLNPCRWISHVKVSFFKFSLKWLGCYSIHLPNKCADLWMCKFIPTLMTSWLCHSDGLWCVSSILLVPLYQVPWWKGIRTLTGAVVDYLVTFLTNVLLDTFYSSVQCWHQWTLAGFFSYEQMVFAACTSYKEIRLFFLFFRTVVCVQINAVTERQPEPTQQLAFGDMSCPEVVLVCKPEPSLISKPFATFVQSEVLSSVNNCSFWAVLERQTWKNYQKSRQGCYSTSIRT